MPFSGRSCAAFTLIEVLIVVVIMAVLAGILIPQLSSSTLDAREGTLKYNLHSLRSTIEIYKAHHAGNSPAVTAGQLPQLTSATDGAGNIGAAGPAFPHGPYVNELPPNPFTGSSKVTAVVDPPSATGTSDAGWLYDPSTGKIWADRAEYLGL